MQYCIPYFSSNEYFRRTRDFRLKSLFVECLASAIISFIFIFNLYFYFSTIFFSLIFNILLFIHSILFIFISSFSFINLIVFFFQRTMSSIKDDTVIVNSQLRHSVSTLWFFLTFEFLISTFLSIFLAILTFIKSLLPKPPRDLTGDIILVRIFPLFDFRYFSRKFLTSS